MQNLNYTNPTRPVHFKVYATEGGAEHVFDLVQSVLECLNPVQTTDHVLRHLWLEIQWLKTTVREGKVILPNSAEMVLFQSARGEHPVLSKHPLLQHRVENLAAALQPIIER
jgi:hypothetical protein